MKQRRRHQVIYIDLVNQQSNTRKPCEFKENNYDVEVVESFCTTPDELQRFSVVVFNVGEKSEDLKNSIKRLKNHEIANFPPVLFIFDEVNEETRALMSLFPSSDFVTTRDPAEIEYRLEKLASSRVKPHLLSLDEILSGIFDQIQEKVMVVDQQHRIVFVNPGLAEIIGKKPSEMVGEYCYNFKELLCGIEDHEHREGPCGKCKRPIDQRPNITKAFHLGGELKYFEISTYPVKPPGADAPFSLRCFKDVTTRVLLEKELRGQADKIARIVEERTKKLEETKDYLERILEATHDLFFTLNLEKEITYLNRNVCQLGYQPEQLLGQKINVLISDSSFGNFFESVIKKKEPSSLQVNFVTRDEEIRPHVLDAYPLFNERDRVVGILGVSRDITEKKAMEKQLLENAKFSFLGQIAAGLAHEIKNPLAVIEGTSAYCIKKQPGLAQLRESFKVINRNVSHAQKILNDLLDFARPKPLKARPHKINNVIERAINLVALDLEHSDISLAMKLFSPSPIVVCDEKQLNQVFLDLVWNARQAMPRGGSLTITTTINSHAPIGLALTTDICPEMQEKKRHFIKISFSDSGVGIDEKSIKKIFEPFYTSKPKGLGLGLSICRRIIQAHGGTISAESNPGMGTTISIFLPIEAYA